MDKKLKKKFTTFPTSLYNKKWVEKAADKGFEEFIEGWNKAAATDKNRVSPKDHEEVYRWFAILYYSAFESALKTFLQQVLEDGMTDITLCMDELCKVTADIKERRNNEKRD